MSKKIEPIKIDEWIKGAFPIVPPKPDDAFTIKDAMKITGMNKESLRNMVVEKVRKGELKEMKCIDNGRMVKCYIPISGHNLKKQKGNKAIA